MLSCLLVINITIRQLMLYQVEQNSEIRKGSMNYDPIPTLGLEICLCHFPSWDRPSTLLLCWDDDALKRAATFQSPTKKRCRLHELLPHFFLRMGGIFLVTRSKVNPAERLQSIICYHVIGGIIPANLTINTILLASPASSLSQRV